MNAQKPKQDPLDALTETEYQQALQVIDLFNSDLDEDEILDQVEKFPANVQAAARSVVFGAFGAPPADE